MRREEARPSEPNSPTKTSSEVEEARLNEPEVLLDQLSKEFSEVNDPSGFRRELPSGEIEVMEVDAKLAEGEVDPTEGAVDTTEVRGVTRGPAWRYR